MKKAARIVASLILAGAMSAVAMADNDFEFKGYARAGVLYNTSLNNMNGTNAKQVGRLGNENESPYMEAELIKNFKAGKVWGKYHVMLAAESRNKQSWDAASHQIDQWGNHNVNANGTVQTRQAFVEMGGFGFAPKATVWAGKRFYGRDDIHITDFYWRDLSGTGAGVQGLMNGNLDLAMINGENSGTHKDGGNMSNVNFDARYRFDKFEVEGLLGIRSGAADTKETAIMQGALTYSPSGFFNVGSGFSKIALQAGINCANWNLGNLYEADGGIEGTNAYRVSAYGVTDIGGNWQIMPQARFELQTPDEGDSTWDLNLVARPQMIMSENMLLAFEAGLDFANNGDDTYMAYKFTVAPTLKLDTNGFWNRPELRAFVTYVGQDKERGMVSADGKDESELRFGTQAEVWF